MALGFVLAGGALAAIGGGFWLGVQSRTGSPPGLVDGRLAPCPDKPNCANSDTPEGERAHIAPLPPTDAATLKRVMARLGATLAADEDGYLAFTTRSRVFGFVDDTEFRLTPSATQLRAASRVGYSDMGMNAKRVAAIRAALAGVPDNGGG